MTATSEYGVAIAETFHAPESWVPGQEINKDAAAVNTGNVDAFVRMWLTGSMRLLQQTTSGTSVANIGTPADVTDSNLLNMGMTKTNGSGLYYKTLSKSQTINPNNAGANDPYGFGAAMSRPYSEVQAMQSSRLAYAPNGATYAYQLKEETTLPIYVKKSTDNGANWTTAAYEDVAVPAGTVVVVNASTPVEATITDGTFAPAAKISYTSASGAAYSDSDPLNKGTVYVQTPGSGLINVEYESFTPFTDGLYLFLRNEADADVDVNDIEYSGYYVTGTTGYDGSTGTYYALNTNTGGTNRSDYTVKSVAATETTTVDAPVKTTIIDGVINTVAPDTSVLQIYTADYNTVSDNALKWFWDETNSKIYVVKDAGAANAFAENSGASQDIVVEISLTNVGTNAQQWTAKNGTATATYNLGSTNLTTPADKLTFYYNDDVEAGDTTAKLVDKVKLYDGVTNKAYLAFDFDLNVNLESIQVTTDENGNEQATAVSSGWAATTANNTAVNTGATGVQTPSSANAEITKMSWS